MDKSDVSSSFGLIRKADKKEKFSTLPRDKQAQLLQSVHEGSKKEAADLRDEFSLQS